MYRQTKTQFVSDITDTRHNKSIKVEIFKNKIQISIEKDKEGVIIAYIISDEEFHDFYFEAPAWLIRKYFNQPYVERFVHNYIKTIKQNQIKQLNKKKYGKLKISAETIPQKSG